MQECTPRCLGVHIIYIYIYLFMSIYIYIYMEWHPTHRDYNKPL